MADTPDLTVDETTVYAKEARRVACTGHSSWPENTSMISYPWCSIDWLSSKSGAWPLCSYKIKGFVANPKGVCVQAFFKRRAVAFPITIMSGGSGGNDGRGMPLLDDHVECFQLQAWSKIFVSGETMGEKWEHVPDWTYTPNNTKLNKKVRVLTPSSNLLRKTEQNVKKKHEDNDQHHTKKHIETQYRDHTQTV